jgi:hypothetical protein
MATDLQKIISISGESGLYQYLSQGKNSVIAESLSTKKRTSYGMNSRVTSLSDISIYTDSDEISLKDLFLKMKSKLGEESAPDHKAEAKVLVSFFEEVLPNYDRDKFYTSHMKKIVQWYNILKEFASLEFVEEEKKEDEKVGEAKADEAKVPAKPKKNQSDKVAAKVKAPKSGVAKAKSASLPRKSGNS